MWTRARRPTIASLPRREAAAAIDALPFLLVAFLARRSDERQPRRWEVALTALDAGYTIVLTTWVGQTLGQKLVGIRVVDARSLERPRWTRSTIRWAVAGLPYPLATVLPYFHSMLRPEQLGGDVRRPPHQRGDGNGHHEEELELHRRQSAGRWAAHIGAILTKGFGAVDALLALRDPSRRGLGDRAARTVVITARLPGL